MPSHLWVEFVVVPHPCVKGFSPGGGGGDGPGKLMGLRKFSASLKVSASQTRVLESQAHKKMWVSESRILKFESRSLPS